MPSPHLEVPYDRRLGKKQEKMLKSNLHTPTTLPRRNEMKNTPQDSDGTPRSNMLVGNLPTNGVCVKEVVHGMVSETGRMGT